MDTAFDCPVCSTTTVTPMAFKRLKGISGGPVHVRPVVGSQKGSCTASL